MGTKCQGTDVVCGHHRQILPKRCIEQRFAGTKSHVRRRLVSRVMSAAVKEAPEQRTAAGSEQACASFWVPVTPHDQGRL